MQELATVKLAYSSFTTILSSICTEPLTRAHLIEVSSVCTEPLTQAHSIDHCCCYAQCIYMQFSL